VTDERSRGVVLYALTALVLAGGGLWFVRAAPDTSADPRAEAWQQAAEQALPDMPLQEDADTIALRGDAPAERTISIDTGAFALSMVCAGVGHVRVKVSTGERDSGRAVQCSPDPTPQTIRIGLAEQFYLQVAAEEQSAAVFRWQLRRFGGY